VPESAADRDCCPWRSADQRRGAQLVRRARSSSVHLCSGRTNCRKRQGCRRYRCGGAAAATIQHGPPMTATTVLIWTVEPSGTLISVSTPAMRARESRRRPCRWRFQERLVLVDLSPTFLSHLVMVPSKMDSPICGMTTSVPPPETDPLAEAAASGCASAIWLRQGAVSPEFLDAAGAARFFHGSRSGFACRAYKRNYSVDLDRCAFGTLISVSTPRRAMGSRHRLCRSRFRRAARPC
jgi:hypothetical protein